MKLIFKLNNVEFQCEFYDIDELLEFINRLTHNNKDKLQVISIIMKETMVIQEV